MSAESFEEYLEKAETLFKEIVSHEFPFHPNLVEVLVPFGGITAVAGIERLWLNISGENWSQEYILDRAERRWQNHRTFILSIANEGSRTRAHCLEHFVSSRMSEYQGEFYPNAPQTLSQMIAHPTSVAISSISFVSELHSTLLSNLARNTPAPDFNSVLRLSRLARFIAVRSDWTQSIPNDWTLLQSDPQTEEENSRNGNPNSWNRTTGIAEERIRSIGQRSRNDFISRVNERLGNVINTHRDDHLSFQFSHPEAPLLYSDLEINTSSPIDPNPIEDIRVIKRFMFESLANESRLKLNEIRSIKQRIGRSYTGSNKSRLLNHLSWIFPFFSDAAPYIPEDSETIMPADHQTTWRSYRANIEFDMNLSSAPWNRAQQAVLRNLHVDSLDRLKVMVYGSFPIIFVLQRKMNLSQIATILELRRTNLDQAEREMEVYIRNLVLRPMQSAFEAIESKLTPLLNPRNNTEIDDIENIKGVVESALHSTLHPIYGNRYHNEPVYGYMKRIVENREASWNFENSAMCLSLLIGLSISLFLPATMLILLTEIAITLSIDVAILAHGNSRNELNEFAIIDQQLKIAEEFDLETETIFVLFGHIFAFTAGRRALLGSARYVRNAVRNNARINIIEGMLQTVSAETDLYVRLIQLLNRKPEVLDELLSIISDGALNRLSLLTGAARIRRMNGIVNYAKGYVQEVLLLETDWFTQTFNEINNQVIRRLRNSGYEMSDAIFTRLVRDNENQVVAFGARGYYLTDGIIYSTFREGGRDGIVIFSIYESKSSRNAMDLISQVPNDIRRLMNNVIEIDGEIYGGSTRRLLRFSSDLPIIDAAQVAGEEIAGMEPLRLILSVPNQELALANRLVNRMPDAVTDSLRRNTDGRVLVDQFPEDDFARVAGVYLNSATNNEAGAIASVLLDYLVEHGRGI